MDLSNFEDSGVRLKSFDFDTCFVALLRMFHLYQADDLAEVGWVKTRHALENLSDPQQAETDLLKCGRPMLEHIAVRGLMFGVSTLIY